MIFLNDLRSTVNLLQFCIAFRRQMVPNLGVIFTEKLKKKKILTSTKFFRLMTSSSKLILKSF